MITLIHKKKKYFDFIVEMKIQLITYNFVIIFLNLCQQLPGFNIIINIWL